MDTKKNGKPMKFSDAREKLSIGFNNRINNFGETFGLVFQTNKYCISPKPNHSKYYTKVTDTQEITNEFYEFLESHRDLINEYSRDYYKWKSPEDISKKIGYDLDVVLKKLNWRYHKIKNIKTLQSVRDSENGLIVKSSSVKLLSSYDLMKQLQEEDIWRAIKNK